LACILVKQKAAAMAAMPFVCWIYKKILIEGAVADSGGA
jgi:hypothetical protein